MSKLGFDDYVEPLSVFLQRYRELEGDHRGAMIRGEPLPLRRSQSDISAAAGGFGVQRPYTVAPPQPQQHRYHGFGVPDVEMLSPQASDGSIPANPNGPLELSPALTDMNSINNSISMSDGSGCIVREQDRYMPIANVIRIMRKLLPQHAKISDEAKETIQECVSEYISFITSEANDRCQREQRKTITAEDVIWAMSKLGFDDYVEPLSVYLQRYREVEGDHRGAIRGEPLPLRRSQSDISAPAGVYGVPRPYPVAPPPPPPHGYNGFGGGYYVGVYGDGSGASSPQGAPMGGYDPYSQYN
ncbi:hypothetical protein J5N97_026462 [Dioscorea zingiberensis]|uniref:Transcription factor CBF/NF-Y/archaeal histone domain-containing protein n=1 Tax=Dioscorea zingiberensis TaxID=325984 RepID=A0A9D5C3C3_9LILI|nr:hypothetical protein J5N97_026462 [Dioscorea zingiberensis]